MFIPRSTYKERFTDPSPSNFKPQTAQPSITESIYSEKFDPLATDPAINLTGFVLRAAIDIARYNRTVRHKPELSLDTKAHYARLSKAAKVAVVVRIQAAVDTPAGIGTVQAVINQLDNIRWQDMADTPRPIIQLIRTVPYAGTEEAAETTVRFDTDGLEGRQFNQPA